MKIKKLAHLELFWPSWVEIQIKVKFASIPCSPKTLSLTNNKLKLVKPKALLYHDVHPLQEGRKLGNS